MRIFSKYRFLIFLFFFVASFSSQLSAAPFMAYSLKEAEKMIKTSGRSNDQVLEVGGITNPVAMVYDESREDLILIGQANPDERKITLDDVTTALRCAFIHNTCPEVSIDKTPETQKTEKQVVSFKGGIADTQYGMDLLEADILLKNIGLGRVRVDTWEVESYVDMCVKNWEDTGNEDYVENRFWFLPDESSTVGARQGVSVVKNLKVDVEMEIMNTGKNGQKVPDQVCAQFSSALTKSYSDISMEFSQLKRLDVLFKLAGLAEGICDLSRQDKTFRPKIDYWLQDFKVLKVKTPTEHPLLIEKRTLGKSTKTLTIDGGITSKIRTLIPDLKDGSLTALRKIVLISRPYGNHLTWKVPDEIGYMFDGLETDPDNEIDQPIEYTSKSSDNNGCFFGKRISAPGQSYSVPGNSVNYSPSASSYGRSPFNVTDKIVPQRYSSNVGGVMLSGVAEISGNEQAKVDLASGNFSLVVDGKNAQLDPKTFKKFVTALWSVYYSKEDPGISIDPIAKGVDKHMVRYIGKVINNDLGRVMREADYIMKKWAVGTERPNIPGFKDVDDLMAKYGFRYAGASRRFWFVPEDMKFKQGDDMLLFDDGRMTVNTEYVLQNKGVKAEPADEQFARFFTKHYHKEISEKYPVYKELFEYAKMVSLAKYLEENNIPLYWFLMANKDLVITEDSPGTVDALAKGSKYFEGIGIEGGVDLYSQGQYVYDRQAVDAINKAIAKLPASTYSKKSLSGGKNITKTANTESFSFDLGNDSYTVLPQYSLTSGKDRRGIRYQTDMAFRNSGEPGLELVRYYNPRQKDCGEFGNGWHLFIPYQIKSAGSAKREFLNALIPERMIVENLITGKQDLLTFSTDRYSIPGYVPGKLEKSQMVGLFIMADASYRLADKLGNEFCFDPAGYMTDMIFSESHHFHFEYLDDITKAFDKTPYQVRPADSERIEFLSERIPRRMVVKDIIHGDSEMLTFSDKGEFVGYVPEDEGKSRYQILVLMYDTSFRLLDKRENETAFDAGGDFEGMIVSSDRPIIKSVTHGTHKVDFNYTVDKTGKVTVASAYYSNGKEGTKPVYAVHYQYDNDGRLYQVKGSDVRLVDNR